MSSRLRWKLERKSCRNWRKSTPDLTRSQTNKKKVVDYLQRKLNGENDADQQEVDERLVEKIEKYEQTQAQIGDEERKYKEFTEDVERRVIEEQNNSLMIKERLMKEKRDIEYADEHNRLMYFYPEKVDELRASVYAKYRKSEIMESLIKESFNLLQSKIDEQENKLENVNEMWSVVEDKVDYLISKEKEFYKMRKTDTLKTPPFVEVPRQPREDSDEDS